VDIEATGDAGGGFDVGWVSPGEWLQYTVSVATAGSYTVTFRVASALTGGTLHLEAAGVNVTGTVAAPGTGGWQTWQSVTATNVPLSAGTQALRLVFDGGSFNMNSMTFALGAASPAAGGGSAPSGSGGGGSGGGGGGCGLTGLESLLFLIAARRCARSRGTPRRNRRALPSA
jgi:hypothetical protein